MKVKRERRRNVRSDNVNVKRAVLEGSISFIQEKDCEIEKAQRKRRSRDSIGRWKMKMSNSEFEISKEKIKSHYMIKDIQGKPSGIF